MLVLAGSTATPAVALVLTSGSTICLKPAAGVASPEAITICLNLADPLASMLAISSLLESGHIKKISEKLYKFEKDYLLNSPSAASDLIVGHSSNGWDYWKTKQGKTLKEIEKEKLKS